MGSTATLEGSLYELVARGNKDVYYIADTKEANNLFDARYDATPPVVHELRRLPPLNEPDFGRSFEFQLEIAGDVIIEPTLLIDLPSWIPRQRKALNTNGVIRDLSDVSYGYVNGIGFFLFEKIQLLQDNILIQEFSGDALWATSRSRGSLNSAFLDNKLLGIHDGSSLSIGRNATPGRLRLQIPLFGCQSLDDGGFPSLKLSQQNYRIRCFLRKLEDLVEASDSSEKPTPWLKTLQVQTVRNGDFTPFTPLTRSEIETPVILLETRHVYTDADTQKELKKKRLDIPFERLYENIYSQSGNDYAPITRGSTPIILRRLEGVHPASRIISFFRSAITLRRNQLWKITNDVSGSEYYGNLKLLIAGRDRETLFTPLVWNKIVTHAKAERDSGLPFAVMDWGLGDLRSRQAPFGRQLEGSINMTTADRPTLYFELSDIGYGPRSSELRSIVETWASMTVENQRAALWFAN